MKNREVYEFGQFRLDPVGKVVYCGENPLPLTRKVVETLLVLVENSPEVVPKDEIMSAVWPDRVVEEANLTQNISIIRKALAAEAGEPGHIETFAGRGYRLEGPVVHHRDGVAHVEPVPVPKAESRLANRRTLLPAGAVLIAIALVVSSRIWISDPPAIGGLQPVTRMPGKEFQPAVSPDGKSLAFLWARTGDTSPRLWVRDLASGDQRELSSQPGHHSSPAWAPDGRQLAYLRIGAKSTEIVVAGLDRGGERVVSFLSPPAYGFDQRLLEWSPDGKHLAVSYASAPGAPLGIMLLDPETARRRVLTKPDSRAGNDVDPRFSPDGRFVTFLRSLHRGQQELYRLDLGGGEAAPLTRDGRQISGHDWDSRGRAIYFASDRGGEFRLWRMPAKGGEPQPMGLFGSFPLQFTLARSGAFAVYAELNQDRNIWEYDLTGGRWTRLVASTGQDASPQYSPDGAELCFRSDRTGQERLWVAKSDGSAQTAVTPPGIEPSVGRWAPSGQAIVFNTPKTGELHVAERSPDGVWRVRSLGCKGVHPVYSADGRWIYAGGTAGLTRLPAGGGAPERIFDTPGMSLEAEQSGKWLYFVKESLDSSIWRGDLGSKAVSAVVDGLVPGCTSCWSLDKGGIYYLGTRPDSLDHQALFRFDLESGKTEFIAPYPEPLWPLGSGPFSLSPDGKKLLCVRLDSPSSDLNRVTITDR